MSEIKTRSISQLVRPEGACRPERYKIPYYQRGYRWRAEEQVKDLLEDLAEFAEASRCTKARYCLQPIVVVAQEDEDGKYWEVIDGQQRLTTLYMLLHWLGEEEVYDLDFDVRSKSRDYAKVIAELARLRDYVKAIAELARLRDDTPDTYFMSKAYAKIMEWLEERRAQTSAGRFVRQFAATLLDKVDVIWYEVQLYGAKPEEQEQEKIDIFNRLNIGKIPLDDAELVRALFLNQLKGETSQEEILRRGIFATEWLEIEHFLRQESVWGTFFVTNKSSRRSANPRNRILRLFELVAKGRDRAGRATFRYFDQQLRRCETPEGREAIAEGYWQEVKAIFGFLRSCYQQRKYYHRVGLCLSLGVLSLEKLVAMRALDKKSLLQGLEDALKAHFAKIDPNAISYDNDKGAVLKVLLLHNVLTLDGMADTVQNRFPFDLYNDNHWSVEHIHARNSEEIDEVSSIKAWIDYALASLEGLDALPKPQDEQGNEQAIRSLAEIKAELGVIAQTSPMDEATRRRFAEASRQLEMYFSGGASVHNLENLALLSTKDNSALSNSIFPVKRNILLEKEREGKFVPPCTRNVFLKAYSPIGVDPFSWREADRRAYLTNMREALKDYMDIQIPQPQNED